jgi:general secretion pathway protein G
MGKFKFSGGFTLIEMMVVVLIIGLLAGIVGVNVLRYLGEAQVKAAKAQIKVFEQAVELYRMDNGRYPTTDQGLEALLGGTGTDARGYLKTNRIPKDPWGSEYYYVSDGETYTIKSLGRDKIAGTEDDVATED